METNDIGLTGLFTDGKTRKCWKSFEFLTLANEIADEGTGWNGPGIPMKHILEAEREELLVRGTGRPSLLVCSTAEGLWNLFLLPGATESKNFEPA